MRHGEPASATGFFLAFEGVEGAGKSTQVALLAERLRSVGADVVVAREPGSTPLGERVRHTVLGDVGLDVPARSELFLMLAARAAFVEQVVRPGLAAGRVVIADRFELSTLAYQGAGRGLPLADVRQCNRVATGGLEPHATLLLELDPGEGVARQRSAGKLPDRLEREHADFHRTVAAAYRQLADLVPAILRVDARGSVAAVHQRIVVLLQGRFAETFAALGVITGEHDRSAAPAGRNPL